MTIQDLKPTQDWVRDQKDRMDKAPINTITVREMEQLQNVEFYVLKKLREMRGKFD